MGPPSLPSVCWCRSSSKFPLSALAASVPCPVRRAASSSPGDQGTGSAVAHPPPGQWSLGAAAKRPHPRVASSVPRLAAHVPAVRLAGRKPLEELPRFLVSRSQPRAGGRGWGHDSRDGASPPHVRTPTPAAPWACCCPSAVHRPVGICPGGGCQRGAEDPGVLGPWPGARPRAEEPGSTTQTPAGGQSRLQPGPRTYRKCFPPPSRGALPILTHPLSPGLQPSRGVSWVPNSTRMS